MIFSTRIRGGALAKDGQIQNLASGGCWPLDSTDGMHKMPPAVPALQPCDSAQAGPIRHFPLSRVVQQVVGVALADAGLTKEGVAGADTGFVSGSIYGTAEYLDSLRANYEERGPRGIRPTDFSIATQGYPMAALSMAYMGTGPVAAFVNGVTAGFEAISFAHHVIMQGLCKRMVVVGLDGFGDVTRRHYKALTGESASDCIVALVMDMGPLSGAVGEVVDLETGFSPDGELPQTLSVPQALQSGNSHTVRQHPGAGGLCEAFGFLANPYTVDPHPVALIDPLGAYAVLRLQSLRKVRKMEAVA